MASSLLVVDFHSHSGSSVARQAFWFTLYPDLSNEREGNPEFMGLMVYNRSMASKDSRMFCSASTDFVIAYRNTSAARYMEVHRPALSESRRLPVVKSASVIPVPMVLKP